MPLILKVVSAVNRIVVTFWEIGECRYAACRTAQRMHPLRILAEEVAQIRCWSMWSATWLELLLTKNMASGFGAESRGIGPHCHTNVVEIRFNGGLSSRAATRSEEHTSELQSLRHLVCRLLLE